MLRVCKRGHVVDTRRRRGFECLVCKRMRDDRHRLEARLAGKDADRQLAWWHKRMQDPAFRERERVRSLERKQRPEVRVSRRLGIGMAAARDIVEATSR